MTNHDTSAEPAARSAGAESLPHWKFNFGANFVDVAFFSLALAFASLTTIVPLYIRALGGSTLLIGLVPSLVQTGFLLPPLFVAPFIARLGRKLPYILAATLGERVVWVLLAVATWLFGLQYPGALLVFAVICLAIFGLSGGITMPAWMDLVAHVTPLRMRGKLFGYSSAVAGLLGVFGGLAAERVLADFPFPINYSLCFAAAAVCMFVSYAGLAVIRETGRQSPADVPTIREYIRRLPGLLQADREFSAFLAARILTAFGLMATGFVSLYAAAERGMPESMAGQFTAWMLGAQVVTTPILGMIGDRRGHKGALQFGLLCSGLAMALAIVSTAPAGFYAVFALLGVTNGIMFTTTLNMVVEFAREESRVTYIGLHATVVAPATMIAPLLGGWLAERSGFGALFIAAGVCCVLAWAVLTFAVRDPRYRQAALVSGTS
jgi:MFS family permease